MTPPSRRAVCWFAALWTLAIVVALSIPGDDVPDVDVVAIDKVVHAAVFAGFAVLWMAALGGSVARRAAVVAATGVAFAVLSELYQGWLPWERTPDVLDAAADVAGLLLGMAGYLAWRRRRVPA